MMLKIDLLKTLVIAFALISQHSEAAVKADIIKELRYHKVAEGETLFDIAKYYDVGIEELSYCNLGVDLWFPKKDSLIVVPTQYILPPGPQIGIVINKAELRLYFFPEGSEMGKVYTFPISIGIPGHETPLGTTHIVAKKHNPTWLPPPIHA